jgi:hypothetical protein
MIFGVDRADGTDIGLVAGGAGCAVVEVDIQKAVTEHGDRAGIRAVCRFDDPT